MLDTFSDQWRGLGRGRRGYNPSDGKHGSVSLGSSPQWSGGQGGVPPKKVKAIKN